MVMMLKMSLSIFHLIIESQTNEVNFNSNRPETTETTTKNYIHFYTKQMMNRVLA